MNLEIRIAETEEIAEIYELEKRIFFGEQGIPAELIPVAQENTPIWWCAKAGGDLVGAVCAWKEEGQTHWGRFAISSACRGKHIGSQLLEASAEALFQAGVEQILCEAREQTVHIVKKLGGVITGDPIEFYEGTCTPMVLQRSSYLQKKEMKYEI